MNVTFFIPGTSKLEPLLEMDPDRDWQRMENEQRWLLQTFLRLHRAGLPVAASRRPPENGVLVFHARHNRQLKQDLNGNGQLVLLCIRSDKHDKGLADFEIVQNSHFADGRRRFFIPYWPQPGLIPRDPSRDHRVENVTFKGFDNNLHEHFHNAEWTDWLASNGLRWIHHSRQFKKSNRDGLNVDWHDYRKVDLVLAFRPPARRGCERRGFTHKPASKLVNAWHAGVPAILGPEVAYQELRKSDLDYIEISEPEHARAAILELRDHPQLYRRMVDNGVKRAAEFSQDRIVDRWSDLLYDRIPQLVGRRGFRLFRSVPVSMRAGLRHTYRWLTGQPQR